METRFRYQYSVDKEHNRLVRINIDMTIAMPCQLIGADVMDSANRELQDQGQLEEIPVTWQLSPEQERSLNIQRAANTFFNHEHHALQDLLWRHSGEHNVAEPLPVREASAPAGKPDACRLRGYFTVNKVAGNLHVTAGKPFDLFGSHAHMSMQMELKDYNFTHRIHHLSFGEAAGGRIHPLDATELVAATNFHMFQYFIKIVPLVVHTRRHSSLDTYQFAVQEHHRPVDHARGSHGVPGIYLKYDVSPLTVRVDEEADSLAVLLVRLAAGAGGLFVTSGLLTALAQLFMELLRGQWCAWGGGARRYTAVAPLPLDGHKIAVPSAT